MPTEQERYHGWYNYETWVVAVWLDNDQDTYFLWRENAKEAVKDVLDDNPDLRSDRPKLVQKSMSKLSQQLFDWLEDQNPLIGQANAFADLLNAALAEVDHLEIARHYLEDELIDTALQEWVDEDASGDDRDDDGES